MFAAHCAACHQRQLIFLSQLVQLVNDERGIVAIYRCSCGALGAERLRTLPRDRRNTTDNPAWQAQIPCQPAKAPVTQASR